MNNIIFLNFEILESNLEIHPEDYLGLYSKQKLDDKFKILIRLSSNSHKQKFLLENSLRIKYFLYRYICTCPKSIKNPQKYSGNQIYFSNINRKLINYFHLLKNIVSIPIVYNFIRLTKLELLVSELIIFDFRNILAKWIRNPFLNSNSNLEILNANSNESFSLIIKCLNKNSIKINICSKCKKKQCLNCITKCILHSKNVSENLQKGIKSDSKELFFMYKNLSKVDLHCLLNFLKGSNSVLSINLSFNKNLTDIFANQLIQTLEICKSVEELKINNSGISKRFQKFIIIKSKGIKKLKTFWINRLNKSDLKDLLNYLNIKYGLF